LILITRGFMPQDSEQTVNGFLSQLGEVKPQESFAQLNEEDADFQETPPGQTKKPEYQMALGGKVIALNGNETLFELEIDGVWSKPTEG